MLKFIPDVDGPLKVLCIGAHSDDIEIGCGGTLLELAGRSIPLDVTWVVLSGEGQREHEARESANLFLKDIDLKDIRISAFRDGFFPTVHTDIKLYFESLKRDISPDIIFSHTGHDAHQDHKLVSELTWNTFRDHMILEYEIVKYDGDIGSPNAFVPISVENCERKTDLLMQAFATQRSRRWFTRDTFMAMLRIRGVECNATDGYAEAFYVRKFTI